MLKKLIAAVFFVSLPATSLYADNDFHVGAGLAGNGDAGSFRNRLERFSDTDGGAWKLFAGWRLGRHLGVEVSHYDFGTQQCCGEITDLGFASDVGGFSAAALTRWPLGRFSPFVKAGVLFWKEDGVFVTLTGATPRSVEGTDLLVGAGLDVDLPAHFGLRAEWERYEFDSSSSDGLWASLLYRF